MFHYDPTPRAPITLREKIDHRALHYIVHHLDEFQAEFWLYDKKKKAYAEVSKEVFADVVGKMYKNLTIDDKGEAGQNLTYEQYLSNPHRRFTKNEMGLQRISRVVRHTISKGKYHDIDMECCHPNLLNQYCEEQEIPHQHLEYFTKNNKQCRQELMDALNYSKDEAKRLMLRCLNGGTLRLHEEKPLGKLEWFYPFFTQMIAIRNEIARRHPNLMEITKKNKGEEGWNLEGSVLNFFMSNIENQLLETAYRYFTEKKIRVGALVYDGLMVDKEDAKEIDLSELNEYVRQKSGYQMNFTIKEMDEGKEIPEDYRVPAEDYPRRKLFSEDDEIDGQWLYEHFDIQEESRIFYRRNVNNYLYKSKGGVGEWYILQESKLWVQSTKPDGIYNDMSDCIKAILESYRVKQESEVNRITNQNQTEQGDPLTKEDEKKKDFLVKSMKLRIANIKKTITSVPTSVKQCIPFLQELYTDRLNIVFDKDWYKFGFANSVLDLLTHEIRPYVREDYMTYHCGYDYQEPSAESVASLNTIIQQIQPDESVRTLLLEIYATSLEGRTLERFIVLNGNGRNGKGLLTELMSKTIGRYYYKIACSALTEHIKQGNNPMMANLTKKRLVVAQEFPTGSELDNGTIKEITGGSTLNTRLNHSNETDIQICPTLMIEANFKPNWKSPPERAEADRILDIHFPSYFTEIPEEVDEKNNIYPKDIALKNPESLERLRCSMMKLLIESHKTYSKNGYKFNIPEVVRQRTYAYITEAWSPFKWMKSVFEPQEDEKVSYLNILDPKNPNVKTKEQVRELMAMNSFGQSTIRIYNLKDIYTEFCETDAFKNMSKIDKRNLTLSFFIDKVKECPIYRFNVIELTKNDKIKKENVSGKPTYVSKTGVWLVGYEKKDEANDS